VRTPQRAKGHLVPPAAPPRLLLVHHNNVLVHHNNMERSTSALGH